MLEIQVQSLSQEDPLEKEMATHPSMFAWETPWTIAHQPPLTRGFPRQEYWRGLPFPSPRDLPDSGIKTVSPALQGDSLITEPSMKLNYFLKNGK